jgi:hypothetical protein
MSYPDPGLGPDAWRGRIEEAEEERRDIERAAQQRDILSQAKAADYITPRPRISDRIRRIFSRGAVPPDSGEPGPSQEQVWERERQRRREYEQDRSNSQD